MQYSKLKSLDVVNVINGLRLGKVNDIDIDCYNGKINGISVLTISKVKSFFRGEELVTIPWDKIVKIGEEVIIVNYEI